MRASDEITKSKKCLKIPDRVILLTCEVLFAVIVRRFIILYRMKIEIFYTSD